VEDFRTAEKKWGTALKWSAVRFSFLLFLVFARWPFGPFCFYLILLAIRPFFIKWSLAIPQLPSDWFVSYSLFHWFFVWLFQTINFSFNGWQPLLSYYTHIYIYIYIPHNGRQTSFGLVLFYFILFFIWFSFSFNQSFI
jgi:hypothetical protein